MNLNEAVAFHLAELHKLGYVPKCNLQTQTQKQVLKNDDTSTNPVPIPGVSILFLFSLVMVGFLTRKPQRFSWWSGS